MKLSEINLATFHTQTRCQQARKIPANDEIK